MAVDSPDQTAPPTAAGNTLRNGLIAITAIVLSVLLFFGLRTQTSVPTLANMAKAAVPLENAVGNGKPTLVEFYADWCTSCQAMAPTMATVEKNYGDRINFVMLNVDNDKWLPEVLAYRVDGIPHFEFLDASAESAGSSLGEQPEAVVAANLDALIAGDTLPYAQTKGTVSVLKDETAVTANRQSDPRSHGAQVKN